MRTITAIGTQRVSDEELGPQIDWTLLKARLVEHQIPLARFCEDIHVWLPDFNRYVREAGRTASARTRLRVAYHVGVLGLDRSGRGRRIVTEGKRPTSSAKAG